MSFTVYKSSAGSGKTYTLVKIYLSLIIKQPEQYRHILAITFTNKACGEMKSRIISQLYQMASGKESPYIALIEKEFGISKEQIRVKSGEILKSILHNYSFFYVETIDTFFQRIVKNFARELGIYSFQNLELDNIQILEKAIRQLFIDIDNYPEIKKWLESFISHQIAQGENYDVKRNIQSLSKELFSESVTENMSKNKSFFDDIPHIISLYQHYEDFIKTSDSTMQDIAHKALQLLQKNGLTVDDFKYKKNGAINYFNNITEKSYDYSTRVAKAVESIDEFYLPQSEHKSALDNAVNEGLWQLLKDAVAFWDETQETYHSAKSMVQFKYTFPILTTIHSIVLDYCKENNIHLLSSNNVLLKKIIGENSDNAPFIYEKTGTFLKHFMLDEFQDTSLLQWNNIKPLIENSLSENNKSMVVGDIKQSIYRWRNGDWTLLGSKIQEDFNVTSFSLNDNYRSLKNIIEFNNHTFESCKRVLQDKLDAEIPKDVTLPNHLHNAIHKVYEDVKQNSPLKNEKEGYIRVNFFENKTFKEEVHERLPMVIEELQDKGFRASEIAIILRENKECSAIVDMLLNYKETSGKKGYVYDAVSASALTLSHSPAINIIINILKAWANPKDTIAKAFVINEYTLRYEKKSAQNILLKPDAYPTFLKKYNILIHEKVSLFEKCEDIIAKLQLSHEEEVAYLKDFQDLALNYTLNNDGAISSFLQWWEEKGSKQSVKLPENQNAIQVLSIHKSKGLEFRAVIIPYCSWTLMKNKDTIVWTENPDKIQFPIHPIECKKDLKHSFFKKEYYTEMTQQYIDNINLLYVALTRAEEALILFCNDKENKNGEFSSISDLLKEALPLENNTCEIGELQFSESPVTQNSGNIPCCKDTFELSKTVVFATHSKQYFENFETVEDKTRWGTILHEILSNIATISDIPKAIQNEVIKGFIDTDEAKEIQQILSTAINNPTAKQWFDGSSTLLSESSILSKDKTLKRPDRILIKNKSAVVVDYKTSTIRDKKHKIQVSEYMQLLTEMGYDSKGYLWYITDNVIEAV